MDFRGNGRVELSVTIQFYKNVANCVAIQNTSNALYSTGNRVGFNLGFQSASGSIFIVQIKTCSF